MRYHFVDIVYFFLKTLWYDFAKSSVINDEIKLCNVTCARCRTTHCLFKARGMRYQTADWLRSSSYAYHMLHKRCVSKFWGGNSNGCCIIKAKITHVFETKPGALVWKIFVGTKFAFETTNWATFCIYFQKYFLRRIVCILIQIDIFCFVQVPFDND